MLRRKSIIAWSLILLVVSTTSVWAHHSTTALFDMDKPISVTGSLTKIDWINPHIRVSIEAKGSGGKLDNWLFETNPPSWYRSVGLGRADFAKAIGQTVTVEAFRAKDGAFYGYMQKIKFADGTSLELVNTADPK